MKGRAGERENGSVRLGGLRVFSLILTLSPLLPLSQAAAQPADIGVQIGRVLDAPAFRDAHWGALVVDLETGETLYAQNADRRFLPASNLKLFTTAGALLLLGPDYRYRTRLYLDGTVRDGTLDGDLVIRGAGDPTFGSDSFGERSLAPFEAWADSLRALGITRVTGAVVGDDDVFDDTPYGLGWAWDDLTYAYGAETSGLTFREGTVELRVDGTRPGRRAGLTWQPFLTPYVSFENETMTRSAGTGVDEGYQRELSGNRFVVTTKVPADGGDTEDLAVHNPTLYAAHTFRLVLLRRGIEVEGSAVDVDDRDLRPRYANLRRAATTLSPTLAEIVEETNLESNNLYAEHLLRTLGVVRGTATDDAPDGSAAAGVLALRPLLDGAGIEEDAVQMVDGSGLSFMDRLTPRSLVDLLTLLHSAEPPIREAFYGSLPIGGQSGTLRRRYPRGPARGNVRAKTGYINGVRTLSGYVTTAQGHPVAFALLANHYSVPTRRVNEAQDTVVEILARYRGD